MNVNLISYSNLGKLSNASFEGKKAQKAHPCCSGYNILQTTDNDTLERIFEDCEETCNSYKERMASLEAKIKATEKEGEDTEDLRGELFNCKVAYSKIKQNLDIINEELKRRYQEDVD